ncbi:hypothetical protein NECAME_01410 [Necator americanus]|uniref:Uncharacterized protein n=1 Tax=Necator americanus TaxID=51031 RepID=W2TV47_NECAM|nr:hypothetical protein NECAME_01410 [Necator americanus]ETN85519.1 hypothetical protein NECAME_01410 [Necator americanus]
MEYLNDPQCAFGYPYFVLSAAFKIYMKEKSKQESGGPITEKSRASKSLFKVVRALRFVIASKQRNPNSRLKKAVLQRKADGAEEERDSSKGTGGKSVELEHDIPKPESKRPPSKESEVEDQATDWTIWV